MNKILMLIIPVMVGCSNMSEREKAWQVTHIIDLAQTYQITKSPCHTESDLITSSIIGENPSGESVIAWGLVSAFIYHYAEDKLPNSVMDMNLIIKMGAVSNNSEIGLSAGSYKC